jgi:hypothetical protein
MASGAVSLGENVSTFRLNIGNPSYPSWLKKTDYFLLTVNFKIICHDGIKNKIG